MVIASDKSQEIVKVWLVDGRMVRDLFLCRYHEGGHGYVYSFIPKDEIWLEASVDPSERPYDLLHEMTELVLMRDHGLSYDKAHAIASEREWMARQTGDVPEFKSFCPTGEGGGIDNSCSPTQGATAGDKLKDAQDQAKKIGAPLAIAKMKEAVPAIASAALKSITSNPRMQAFLKDNPPPSEEEIAKNWSKTLRSKKMHDSGTAAFDGLSQQHQASLQNAINFNHDNPAMKEAIDKFGPVPIIFRQSEKNSPAAAEYRGGAIHVYDQNDASFYKRDTDAGEVKPPPSGWTVGNHDLATVMRHEYGHYVKDTFSQELENGWKALHNENSEAWKKSISPYAAANHEESFAESFALMTHPGFKESNFSEDARKAFAWIRENTGIKGT